MPVGGFGEPFLSLSDAKAIKFLKVGCFPSLPRDYTLNLLDSLRTPILVYHRRGRGKILRPVPLRPCVWYWSVPDFRYRPSRDLGGVAHILPLCYLFPGVAIVVQLDSMYSNDELSCYVCAIERDGYCY